MVNNLDIENCYISKMILTIYSLILNKTAHYLDEKIYADQDKVIYPASSRKSVIIYIFESIKFVTHRWIIIIKNFFIKSLVTRMDCQICISFKYRSDGNSYFN